MMQKFLLKISVLALAFSGLLFVGCGDDPIINPPLGPEITLQSGTGFITSDATLEPAEPFTVSLKVQKGDNPLQSIAIFKRNADIDNSAAVYTITSDNVGVITPNSPFLLTGADVNGGTFNITIIPDDVDADFSLYSFEVTDSEGLKDEVSLGISTVRTATPLSNTYTTVVVNNADGPNNGGLDLDVGANVPFNSNMAELRDEGIDLGQTTANNWIQRVRPVNGAILRLPDASQMETLRYENVDSREAIVAAYDTGTDVTQSPKLQTGQLLLVKKGNDYYLLEVGNVVVTTNNNQDYYEFNIKQSKG